MKYQRFTPLCCTDLGIRKSEFVAKAFSVFSTLFYLNFKPPNTEIEIKSLWKFETLFSRSFFGFSIIFYKNVPGKKSPIKVENAWEQRMISTMHKKGAIDIKNTHTIQNTDA